MFDTSDDDLFGYLTPKPDRTFALTLPAVRVPRSNPKDVVLHLRFCGEGTAFYNERRAVKPSSDRQAERMRLAGLLAKHGIASWDNVEKNGLPVPYMTADGVFVLERLIAAKLGEVIEVAAGVAENSLNFCDGPAVEAAELGKG